MFVKYKDTDRLESVSGEFVSESCQLSCHVTINFILSVFLSVSEQMDASSSVVGQVCWMPYSLFLISFYLATLGKPPDYFNPQTWKYQVFQGHTYNHLIVEAVIFMYVQHWCIQRIHTTLHCQVNQNLWYKRGWRRTHKVNAASSSVWKLSKLHQSLLTDSSTAKVSKFWIKKIGTSTYHNIISRFSSIYPHWPIQLLQR